MVQKTKSLYKNHYEYVIIVTTFLAVVITNYVGFQFPPLSHLIIPELDIDEAAFSKLFASFMLPGVLLSLVGGLLCDKFGTKRCITVCSIISFIGIVGRIFIFEYGAFYIFMFLAGIMQMLVAINVPKIMANWVPSGKIGVYIGFIMAGSPLGMALAMATSAMFPSIKSAFISSAIAYFVVMLIWIIFLKNSPNDRKENNRENLINKPSAVVDTIPLGKGLKIVMKNKYMWLMGICFGFFLSAVTTINTFLPLALQVEKGMSAVTAGGLTSITMIGNIFGALAGPSICYRIGSIRKYLVATTFLMAILTAFVWKDTDGIVLIIGLFVLGFAVSAALTQMISMPVLFKDIGATLAGTASGFVTTIRLFLSILLPSYIIMPLVGDNYVLLYYIMGGFGLIAGAMSIALPDFFQEAKSRSKKKQ